MNVYTWKLSGGRNGTLPSSIPKAQNLENWSGFLALVLPRCPDVSVYEISPGFIANPHGGTVPGHSPGPDAVGAMVKRSRGREGRRAQVKG